MIAIETSYSQDQSGAFVETFTIEPRANGPLEGLSFAVKDIIDIEGHLTSCGNPSWRDSHPPAVANAVCVDQLLHAGASCAGKTVTDELAFSLDGQNHFFGTPLNPRAPDRVPGGSSSGSASAVACGLVDFALGTDTGGSVRVPASNCGIFGIRPSHGVVSVAGVNPLAPTFDTVGVLAREAHILAKAASVLLSCQVMDAPAVGTIHLLEDAFQVADPQTAEAMAAPVELLKGLFPGRVKSASLADIVGDREGRNLHAWYETYCWLQWAEIRSCLGSWVEHTAPDLGPRIRINFDLTKHMDRGQIGVAALRREAYCNRLGEFLGANDLICMPTSICPAPLKGSLGLDRTKCDYFPRALSLTAVAGIGRLPQVSLPLAQVDGLPVGLSLLASRGRDGFLLGVMQVVAMAAKAWYHPTA